MTKDNALRYILLAAAQRAEGEGEKACQRARQHAEAAAFGFAEAAAFGFASGRGVEDARRHVLAAAEAAGAAEAAAEVAEVAAEALASAKFDTYGADSDAANWASRALGYSREAAAYYAAAAECANLATFRESSPDDKAKADAAPAE